MTLLHFFTLGNVLWSSFHEYDLLWVQDHLSILPFIKTCYNEKIDCLPWCQSSQMSRPIFSKPSGRAGQHFPRFCRSHMEAIISNIKCKGLTFKCLKVTETFWLLLPHIFFPRLVTISHESRRSDIEIFSLKKVQYRLWFVKGIYSFIQKVYFYVIKTSRYCGNKTTLIFKRKSTLSLTNYFEVFTVLSCQKQYQIN